MSGLHRLGALVVRRSRLTLLGGLVATLLFAAIGAGAMGAMVLSRWEAPGTESVHAQDVLRRDFGTGNANLILLVTARTGTVDDAAVRAAGQQLADDLRGRPLVGDVWSYWSDGNDPMLRGADGRQALVLAH